MTTGSAFVAAGGILSAGVVAAIVVTPPVVLSPQLAMSRAGTAPFSDAESVHLASTGDIATFGVGDWVTVFATATDPDAFAGTPVTLTGFATPGEDGFFLTRMVITHCVIDAQPASLPVATQAPPADGEWVTVTGTVRDVGGALRVEARSVQTVPEPEDPYEY